MKTGEDFDLKRLRMFHQKRIMLFLVSFMFDMFILMFLVDAMHSFCKRSFFWRTLEVGEDGFCDFCMQNSQKSHHSEIDRQAMRKATPVKGLIQLRRRRHF